MKYKRQKTIQSLYSMPQTLLNDQLWLKLKPILLDLNIYDKPNLRNICTGFLFRLKTDCQWRYLHECYEILILFLKHLDAHGNPLDFIISGGVTHDVKIVPDLIKKADLNQTRLLNADRGYISEQISEPLSHHPRHY